MTVRRIHLVFKTHLDIGFTDHAEKVRRLYHEHFIPRAVETAMHFHREDPEAPAFIWTTGAWLIWDHLNSAAPEAVRQLEDAIGKGLVRWHGLPFTTHSELMSPALFRAGLSYSAELDKRFGVTTRAAKMTDVPGHTLGIVPLLAEAGIRFLHIGVNTACPTPEVPGVFRWRSPAGEEVVVMYQRSYGETHVPSGFDEGLSFAHTNDNMGPQAVHQAVEAHRALAHQYPEAEIRAATLEDFGDLLWAARERFPVVEAEMGDSWIHGVASDPIKTQRFLSLQRLFDEFVAEGVTDERRAFARRLALVPEHTWGVDIKTYLRDESAWDRREFDTLRDRDFRFAYTEASWAEQRAYLDQAVEKLDAGDRARAEAAIKQSAAPVAVEGGVSLDPAERFSVGAWQLELDAETGDVVAMAGPGGLQLPASGGALIGYRHESYDAADIRCHLQTYLTSDPEWAVLDHGKPGLEHAATSRSQSWRPRFQGVAQVGAETIVTLAMPAEAHESLGAPQKVEYRFTTDGTVLECRVVLRHKPANRMPEAGFLVFSPIGASWHLRKMGLWHRAGSEAAGGGGALQAVSAVRAEIGQGHELTLAPMDTPLVGPEDHGFMAYSTVPPAYLGGIRFNLYNNKWGTNFPMWWEGDLAARFRMAVNGSL
ncbi:MAG TPA: DUF5054 domain-containing protein [Devosiaceae bacterium]